ncbi:MAG: hypothetical protein L6Q59_10560 [Ignavibacteriaceae bacterium]|nr:hypothetical protein [Ignavibacteriaceae bacterium]
MKLSEITQKFSENKAELFWFLQGQAFVFILNIAMIKIISQAGTEVYGNYVLVLTISAFASQILFGPFQQGFIRKYFDYEKTLPVFNNTIVVFLNRALMAVLISAALVLLISKAAPANSFYTLLFFGLIFTAAQKFTEFFNGILNAARKRKENSILQTGEKIVITALLLGALYFSQMTFLVIIFIFSVINFLSGSLKLRILGIREKSGFRFSGEEKILITDIVKYSAPFIIWGAAGWLQLNSEKWIVNGLLSLDDVAYYGIMISLVNAFIAVPSNIISEFFTPLIFKNFSGENPDIKKGRFYIMITTLTVMFLGFGAGVLFIFTGEFFITLISNKSYTLQAAYLAPIAFGNALFYAGQTLALKGLALNRPGIYMIPKILTGVISVGLYYFLIKFYGFAGLGYAVIISGSFYLAVTYIANLTLEMKRKPGSEKTIK